MWCTQLQSPWEELVFVTKSFITVAKIEGNATFVSWFHQFVMKVRGIGVARVYQSVLCVRAHVRVGCVWGWLGVCVGLVGCVCVFVCVCVI
jgi:hypothetical protein